MSKRTRSQVVLPDGNDLSLDVSPLKEAKRLASTSQRPVDQDEESDDEILLSPKKKRPPSPDEGQRVAKRARMANIFGPTEDRPTRPKGTRKNGAPHPLRDKGVHRAHSVPAFQPVPESSRAARVVSVPPMQPPSYIAPFDPFLPTVAEHDKGRYRDLQPVDPQAHFKWEATLSPIPVSKSFPPVSAEATKPRPRSPPRSSSALSSDLSSPPVSDNEQETSTPRGWLTRGHLPSSPLTPIPPTPHPLRSAPALDTLVPLKVAKPASRAAAVPVVSSRHAVGDDPKTRAPRAFGHSRIVSDTQPRTTAAPEPVRTKTLAVERAKSPGVDVLPPTKPLMTFGNARRGPEPRQKAKYPATVKPGQSSTATSRPAIGKNPPMKQSTLFDFSRKPSAGQLASSSGLSSLSDGTELSSINSLSNSILPANSTPRRLSVKDRMRPKTPKSSIGELGDGSSHAGPSASKSDSVAPQPLNLEAPAPKAKAKPLVPVRPKLPSSRSVPGTTAPGGGRVTRSTSSQQRKPKLVPKVQIPPKNGKEDTNGKENTKVGFARFDKGKGKASEASPLENPSDMDVDNETDVEPSYMGSPMRMTPNVSVDRMRVDLTPPPAIRPAEKPPSVAHITRALEKEKEKIASLEQRDISMDAPWGLGSLDGVGSVGSMGETYMDVVMPIKDMSGTPGKPSALGTPRSSVKSRMKPRSAPGTPSPIKSSKSLVEGIDVGKSAKGVRAEFEAAVSRASSFSGRASSPTPSKSTFPKSAPNIARTPAPRKSVFPDSAANLKSTIANFNTTTKKSATNAPVKDGKLSSFFTPASSAKKTSIAASSTAVAKPYLVPASLTKLTAALDRLNVPIPVKPDTNRSNTSMGFNPDAMNEEEVNGASSSSDRRKGKEDEALARRPSGIGMGRPALHHKSYSSGSAGIVSTLAGSSKDRPSSMFAPPVTRPRTAFPNAPTRTAIGTMAGRRLGARASRETTLESVEASPVKGQRASTEEQEPPLNAMDSLQPQGGSAPPARAGSSSDVFDASELVMKNSKPVKESGRAARKAWVTQTSQRASLASHALSQSLSALPKSGLMGPPAIPIGRAASSTYPNSAGSKTAPAIASKGKAGHVSRSGKNDGQPRLDILKGCVFFVDVRDAAGEDTGGFFADMLQDMGGRVLTRVGSTCTHIVFKNGLLSTVTRWRLLNEPKPHVVGIAWVVECAEQLTQADENAFKFDIENYNMAGINKKRKSMIPKSLTQEEEEDLSRSYSSQGEESMDEGSSSLISNGDEELTPLERARKRNLLLPKPRKK